MREMDEHERGMWERCRPFGEMRATGLYTLKQIGQHFGRSQERVRQLANRYERYRKKFGLDPKG